MIEPEFASSKIVSDTAKFKPRFKPLTDEGMKILAKTMFAEAEGAPVNLKETDPDYPVLLKILDKRIEVLKLPISFNLYAKIGMLALLDGPGALVTLLIDALNKFEGKEVTVQMLCDLYPFGFYDDKSFEDYVDNYLKTRKVKWSEIY
jgi:hypothetical protein